MGVGYDFTETPSTITLVFYISPQSNGQADFELLEPTVVGYNGERLRLYKPVHSPRLVRSNYLLEATMTKEAPEKWYAIDGRRAAVCAKNPLDAAAEEQPPDGEGLLDVLTSIYARGNDDVKKAMNKSLLESEGTVLSTDWKAVSQKKVEPEN